MISQQSNDFSLLPIGLALQRHQQVQTLARFRTAVHDIACLYQHNAMTDPLVARAHQTCRLENGFKVREIAVNVPDGDNALVGSRRSDQSYTQQ